MLCININHKSKILIANISSSQWIVAVEFFVVIVVNKFHVSVAGPRGDRPTIDGFTL